MKASSLLLLGVLALAAATATAAYSYPYTGPRHIMAGGKLIESTGVPLFDYVNAPDSNYQFYDTKVRLNKTKGWTGIYLNMTSQQWLTPQEVSRSVWWHMVLIIKPDVIKVTEHAFIYNTGGHNDNHFPSGDDADIIVASSIAVQTGGIAVVVYQVPNQSLRFAEDPLQKDRSEDGIVAYTWKRIADHPERPDWAAYLPMVKSVVRAMDAAETYCADQGWAKISKWIVAGASKRGATTWLTGAYDGSLPAAKRRVVGIVPIVFDMLHLSTSVAHMFEAYGGWTFAFGDYWDNNVTSLINTPKMSVMAAVVDPISYVDTLTMPKLVITATGDEFFMPDDNWYWWDELKAEKHMLMIENAEHSMATGVLTLAKGVSGFINSLIFNTPRPDFAWTIDSTSGRLTLTAKDKPAKVTLMYAETVPSKPNRRDFRMIKGNTPAAPCEPPAIKINDKACFNPILWQSKEVQPVSTEGFYTYEHSEPVPASGNWMGFFFQVEYPSVNNSTHVTTTQVSIVPNVMPFKPCGSGDSCKGQLV